MSAEQQDKVVVIGTACHQKKQHQFFQPFAQYCANNKNVKIIDILNPKNEELEIDILFMKVTDFMNNYTTNEEAKNNLDYIKNFIAKRPNLLVVEDLEYVSKCLERTELYNFLKQELAKSGNFVSTPAFAIIDESNKSNLASVLAQHEVKFPVVVKSYIACGKSVSHDMAIVFNEKSLEEVIASNKIPLPIIAQRFVNHGATLYKTYVISPKNTYAQMRPSIRDFSPEESETIHFNSQVPFPSSLSDTSKVINSKEFVNKTNEELKMLFDKASAVLSKAIHLELFGYDLIIDNETGKYYIVDVNYFPTYGGVPDVHELILQYLLNKFQQHQQSKQQQ